MRREGEKNTHKIFLYIFHINDYFLKKKKRKRRRREGVERNLKRK